MQQILRTLTDPNPDIGTIVRRNLICYGFFYLMAAGMLLLAFGSTSHHGFGPIPFFCAMLVLPPLFVWVTYRECRRAFRGELPDDDSDTSMPFAVMVGAGIGLRILIYLTLGY